MRLQFKLRVGGLRCVLFVFWEEGGGVCCQVCGAAVGSVLLPANTRIPPPPHAVSCSRKIRSLFSAATPAVCLIAAVGWWPPQVTADSKRLVLLWKYCLELASRVGRVFEALKPMALLLLLQLLTAAATAAIDMQHQAAVAAAAVAAAAAADAAADDDGGSSSSSSGDEGVGAGDGGSSCRSRGSRGWEAAGGSSSAGRRCHHRRSGSSSSYGVISGPRSALGDISSGSDSSDDELHTVVHVESSGSWCVDGGCSHHRPRGGAGRRVLLVAPVCDETVQAQAWLPHLLQGLLHYASSTAKQVRGFILQTWY